MAYNFYDLRITGQEIKRRLDLLAGINTDDGIATNNQINHKANIITNTVYGQNIKIDDILREKTPMCVRVSSKNIIPFPYYEVSDKLANSTKFSRDGLTFKTWNVTNSSSEMKGQINISGTLMDGVSETSYILFSNDGLSDNNLILNGPTTFSCEFKSTNGTLTSARIEIETIKLGNIEQTEEITILNPVVVFEDVKSIKKITLIINTTTEITQAIIKPQLEIGRFATPYSPYISDFSGIKLYKSNENLLQLNNNVIIIGDGSETNDEDAFYVLNPVYASSGTFTVSVDFKKIHTSNDTSASRPALQLRKTNGKLRIKTVFGDGDEGTITYTFTLDSTYANGFQIWLYGHALPGNANVHCKFSNIQIKVADNDIDFSNDAEQSITTTEYEFTDSQVITNIEALYPTTSFYTNNFSALLEVEYYADLKKYIDNNYSQLDDSQIGYIDAGRITDYI